MYPYSYGKFPTFIFIWYLVQSSAAFNVYFEAEVIFDAGW